MKHYAGDVTYASLGFREKNKDTLHPDLSGVMRESQSDFVRTLFPDDSVAASPAKGVQTRGGKKGKKNSADKMTVGSQFMQQLASLMGTINGTGVHYVRCIKPNVKSEPRTFELAHTAHQLRCAGVLEAIRISRMAYPNRMPHADFVRVYTMLAGKSWAANAGISLADCKTAPPADAAMRKACEALLKVLVEEEGRYQLGKSKVFFRAFMLEKLEQRRGAALAVSVVLIQRHARGALWRQRFLLMKRSAVKLQAAGRRAAKRQAFTKARAAAVALEAAARRRAAAVRYARQRRACRTLQRAARRFIARYGAATTLQAAARRRSCALRFGSKRRAALRVQSAQRMATQRRAYAKALAEKKEEAKLSTQLERIQAQLQACLLYTSPSPRDS